MFSTSRPNTTPRTPFTHEETLKICNYYRNLLASVRSLQGTINAAIDTFTQNRRGTLPPDLTALLTTLSSIDATLRTPLLDEIMQVELCAIKWEAKSSRLRSEAQRQRRKRQRRRDGESPTSHATQLEDEFGPFGDESDEVGAGIESNEKDFYSPPALPDPSVISPTMALAQRGMSQLPEKHSSNVPSNDGYKKSGLV